MNMNNCNDFSCPNMNSRGDCSVTACTNPNKYNINSNKYNTNFKKDIIVFPQTIGNKTFYSRKELEDYILMIQDENYGKGNWC